MVDTCRARDRERERERDRKTTPFELLMFRQLASWQDQFDRMDLNHDGVLQRSEYDRGMQAQSDMCGIVSYILTCSYRNNNQIQPEPIKRITSV